jgi:hypothetical protein
VSELHAAGGVAVLIALLALAMVAVAVAVLDRGHAWTGRAEAAVLVIVAAQVALGGIAWLGGSRPREDLHLLYGLAVLGALLLAASFAAEAPPRARAGVTAVAAAIALVLTWRLYLTG